jgi:hypothetical protein
MAHYNEIRVLLRCSSHEMDHDHWSRICRSCYYGPTTSTVNPLPAKSGELTPSRASKSLIR